MNNRVAKGLLLLLLFSSGKVFPQAYRVGVDPRIELFSIVFRLAGNNEYTQGRVPAYLDAIDRYFAPYRNHPAIQFARELAQKDAVGFGLPMNLAVHVADVRSLSERIPFDAPHAGLDPQWNVSRVRHFLELLRSFVADTKFEDFLKSQQSLYQATDANLQKFVNTSVDLEWYSRFFGVRPGVRLIVVPGMVNGGPSYGTAFTGNDGITEMYSIPGVVQVDPQGLPLFTGDFLDMTVHEFAHSFSNPIVDGHYADMAKSGDELYSHVAAALRRQAYANGKALLYESMVRGVTIRYIFEHQGPEAGRRALQEQRNNSFLWIGDLCDLLSAYEQDRTRYPTLESFAPRIVSFFNEEAPHLPELSRLYDQSRPRVVSMSIANHAQDIDPDLTEIVVRFSQPLRPADAQDFNDPRFGRSKLEDGGRTLKLSVSLESGKSYRFQLGWPSGSQFVSNEGVPADDYWIDFRTRPAVSVTRQTQ